MYDNQLDQQVAAALGWQDYSATEWAPVEDAEERGAMRRQVRFPLSNHCTTAVYT